MTSQDRGQDPGRADRRRRLRAIPLLAVAALGARTACADDCAPIPKAMLATMSAPASRQYMSSPLRDGGKERLFAVALGDTMYLTSPGGKGGWQKMDRRPLMRAGQDAAADMSLSDCKTLGTATINGVETAGYEFTAASKSGSIPQGHATIWIGPDGLLRKQQVSETSIRYEFDNVKAPVP